MKTRLKTLILSAGVCCSLATPTFAQSSEANRASSTVSKECLGDMPEVDFGKTEKLVIRADGIEHVFNVEVARTRDQQNRGFMCRENIPGEEGLLFEFGNNEVQRIWMKNTPTPLDIIFVRANGRILKIERNARPYSERSASSEAPVAAVLELVGGRSLELGIMPGDVIVHSFFTPETPKTASSSN